MTVCIQAEGEFCPGTPELFPWRIVQQWQNGEWVTVESGWDGFAVISWIIWTVIVVFLLYKIRAKENMNDDRSSG